MTNKKVAVEANLSNIRNYLSQQGYDCVQLNEQSAGAACDAIVISGADQNLMGIQDATTKVPVINAHGLTPQEVAERLQQQQQ
ncbi:MAG: YkuS family protein [Tumebacillaceae bacterium]